MRPCIHLAVALLRFTTPALLVGACDGSGTFEPQPDVGPEPGEGGVIAAQIGTTCTYDYDGRDPTNDCAAGLTCFIFTGDGRYTTDLVLSAWEDQMTVYLGERDDGYCTLVGSLQQPPVCPAGTAPKVFTPDVVACLRICNESADCSRADYVCDARYYDMVDANGRQLRTCVKPCTFDVPDCVRSGVVQVQGDNGQPVLVPALAFDDLSGASRCDQPSGICAFVGEPRGTAGPGEPCADTSQCEAGSACIMPDVVGAVTGVTPGLGFCASSCTPAAPGNPPGSNCSPGYVCQAAGDFTFNFESTIVIDLATGNMDRRGGFCFHQCADPTVEGACDGIPGTACGSLDESAVQDVWNATPMCLPDALRQ